MNAVPKQTEAQRLADACDAEQVATVKRDILMHDVAALLLRQDELLVQALEVLESSRVLKADHLTIESYGEAVQKRNAVIGNIRAHREQHETDN